MYKKYIITGGSGFIGKTLVQSLLLNRNIEEIHIIDIKPSEIDNKKVIYHNCDIRKKFDINIKGDNTVLIHLAALCKEPGYLWDEYFDTNHSGTANVSEFAERKKIHNIVFTSTMMIFRAAERAMSEASIKSPDTAYGMSKLLAEMELEKWMAGNNKNRLRIVRPGVVFGKNENGNYTRLYYALRKGMFFYVGKKTTVKSSIYVKDVVRFIDFLVHDRKKNITYNIAFPQSHTISEICETFKKAFNMRRFIPTVPYFIMIAAGYTFEFLNALKILKSGIHHRRIQKLFLSTHITSDLMVESGFKLEYTLESALIDWRNECAPDDLY